MTARRLLAHRDALRELAIFALAYLVYFGVRAVTEGSAAAMRAQCALTDRPRAPAGDRMGRSHAGSGTADRLLVDAANAVYMYGHWPVIIVAGVLLFRYRHRITAGCATSAS